jgi:hypothetical protein
MQKYSLLYLGLVLAMISGVFYAPQAMGRSLPTPSIPHKKRLEPEPQLQEDIPVSLYTLPIYYKA